VTLLSVLLGVWALGAALLLGRIAIGAVVLSRILRRATPLGTPDWRHPLLEAADRLALERVPRLLTSERLPMPFACGVIRPAIVLPVGAAEWSDRRRRAVLLHELAHLSRFDLALNALGQLACALYWFHPLVWLAVGRLRSESERACDDLVLGVGTRASEYADHLLQIVCRATRARTPAIALPMAQRHEFEGRLLAILERGARREPASRRHAVMLGALVLALVIPLAALTARQAPASLVHEPAVVPPDTATVGAPAEAQRPAPERQVVLPPERPPRSAPVERVQRGDSVGVVAALIRALGDSVPAVREDAAYALGRREAAAAVEPLGARLARDPTPAVREMCAWALGQIANRSAVPALGAAAQRDSAESVRAMAVWALGQLEDASAVPALVAVLRDASAEVRGRAAWALGTIEPDAAPPGLVAALSDRSADVRMRAAWALGQIEDPTTVPPLGRTLRDSTSDVRRAALWALGQIGGDAAGEALLAALEDPDPEVRAGAARALAGGHGHPWPWPWPMPLIR
jgi:beta-lactamase regulating signal transducer with metallopeptidase domain